MSRAIVLTSNKIAILIGAAILAGYMVGRWSTGSNSSSSTVVHRSNNGKNRAFVLLVNMKFTSLAHRGTFLEWIKPVCDEVLANEGPPPSSSDTSTPIGTASATTSSSTQTTFSYQVAISDKDPLMVVLIERYSDKDHGYLAVHRSGPEFLTFRDKLKGMQKRGDVAIEGESYLETDLGYV